MYCDGGWSLNGVDTPIAILFGQSCYHLPNLQLNPFGVTTHTTTHTTIRAPGTTNFNHQPYQYQLKTIFITLLFLIAIFNNYQRNGEWSCYA